MSAEREEMPMESEENVEKETEREEDSESSDDSGDEEAADNPRIAELEIQVQSQQVSWWAILNVLSIQKIVFLQFWLAVKPGCYRRMVCVSVYGVYFVFQLKTNPYMYDHHVELITLLKTAGDFDKLRAAREAMNRIFPLTEGTKSKPKFQFNIA